MTSKKIKKYINVWSSFKKIAVNFIQCHYFHKNRNIIKNYTKKIFKINLWNKKKILMQFLFRGIWWRGNICGVLTSFAGKIEFNSFQCFRNCFHYNPIKQCFSSTFIWVTSEWYFWVFQCFEFYFYWFRNTVWDSLDFFYKSF